MKTATFLAGWTLVLALAMALFLGTCNAQTPVTTYPVGVATTNASGSIASSTVFQQVLASNTLRRNCVIQNTGIHTMWVFFGSIASATQATSFPLYSAGVAGAPGGFVQCAASGVVATDQVSITGTAADTFTATSQ